MSGFFRSGELTYSVGDHAFDIWAATGYTKIAYFGVALQRGGRLIIGSGGLQIASPQIVPLAAVVYETAENSSSGCMESSSNVQGTDLLPGFSEIPDRETIGSWWAKPADSSVDPGKFQFIVECWPVTLKFMAIGD